MIGARRPFLSVDGSFRLHAPIPCVAPPPPPPDWKERKKAPRLVLACCDTASLLGLYGGREKRERIFLPPPLHACMSTYPPSLFLSLTTEHCSCWATFTQSEWTPVVRGHMWPFMDQRGAGGGGGGVGGVRGEGGVSMASLSRHVCPLPPSAHHKHRDKGMQTHTHTGRVSWHVSDHRFLHEAL